MPIPDHAPPEFESSLLINAAPTRVLMAFFDPHALATWWQVVAIGHDAAPDGHLRGRMGTHA